MMNRKKKKQPVLKTTLDILPIRSYDEKLGGFKLKDGSYMDLCSIIPSDRSNLQGDELKYSIYRTTRFYRLYSPDIKLISMNFPVNTQGVRAHLVGKRDTCGDAVRKVWLERQIHELELVDQNVMRREYYLMYFGKDRDDYLKNKDNIEKWIGMGRSRLISPMEKEQKIQIVRKLSNMNTLVLPSDLKDDETYE